MTSPNAPTQEDCTFCEILVEPATAFDVGERLDAGDITLVPSLGMLVPGYLHAITPDHVTSFAQLPAEELAEIDSALDEIESQLSPLFGNYFRMEHGSDNLTTCGSGGCIDHAHLHLIPADDDVGEHMLGQLPWQEIDSYEALVDFEGEPYIYLGRMAAHYVVPNPDLHGQWARRQVAEVRGMENFDWAVDPGNEELSETFAKIGSLPRGFQNYRDHPLVLDHLAVYPAPTPES